MVVGRLYIISYQEYQFWTIPDEEGCFSIKNVYAGNYHFYASAPGFIGDNQYDVAMSIAAGLKLSLFNSFYHLNVELGDTNNAMSWLAAV